MAIDLSAYNAPFATSRKTLNASAGTVDALTLPSWAKFIEIIAAGTGDIKMTHASSSATDYITIKNGGSYVINSVQLPSFSIKLTGTVDSDPVEFMLKAGLEG